MADSELDRAVSGLRAQSETQRLAAARIVLQQADPPSIDIENAVRDALAVESVPWVRGVLAEILARNVIDPEPGATISAPRWDDQLEAVDNDLARQVLHTSTRRILHEVAAVVGRANLAATNEFGSPYSDSQTRRQLEYLIDVCQALRTLATATQTPITTEFDLSEKLVSLAETIGQEFIFSIHADGPTPFIVFSDWKLLQLAVRNILINAIEATLSLEPPDPGRAVVLTWGSSVDGSHITVIDRGPGPPRFLLALGQSGVSTKEGHPGYGLATASEAMRSLGGDVSISRNERGGATLVLSWSDE